MLRHDVSLFGSALLVFAAAQAPAGRSGVTPPSTTPPTPSVNCLDRFPSAPVLTYDVAGTTLWGPMYFHLAIYSDGHAIASRSAGTSGSGECTVALLERYEIDQLRAELEAANAFSLCDQPLPIHDVPLRTVSVYRGGTDAEVHTFSYLIPSGPAANVQLVVDRLLQTEFPGF